MRKKSGFTIVEQAIVLVPDFEKVAIALSPLPGIHWMENGRISAIPVILFIPYFNEAVPLKESF